jgi:translation initiation factor 2B subunit (eIF-2B alpha/beta/delta family)
MTYKIRHNDDETWDLLDESGNVVSEANPSPCETPDDVIDAILTDLGVTEPYLSVFQTILTRDWGRVER